MHFHQRNCLAVVTSVFFILTGCSREPAQTAQEVVGRCLAAEGGEDRWRSIRTIRRTVNKTITVADNAPIQSVEVLEWDIARSRWRLESSSDGTSRLTIGNASRATTYRLNDGKIVGASDSEAQLPSLSESITLAERSSELRLIELSSAEPGKGWELVSDTEEDTRWQFDTKSSLLSKKIVASSYGESETKFFDYRHVGGVQFPFKIRTEVKQASYAVEEIVQAIELDVQLDDSRFEFDDSWRRIKAGELIPEFELADTLQQGKIWTRESVRGGFVLLDFWATWCGPCIAEFPELQQIHKRFKDTGFQVLAISLDSDIDQHRSFVEKRLRDWGNAVVAGEFDSEIARRFEISSIPRTILVDPDGVIVAVDEEARGEKLIKLLSLGGGN